jgi:hypothetical protein
MQVIEVNSWEDWTDRISDVVEFKNGNVARRFKVWSLSVDEQSMIASELRKNLPPEPKRRRDKNGNMDYNDPNYEKAREDWAEKSKPHIELATLRWIEYGWAKPNGIEIPGANDQEKLANLKKKIAGDVPKLRDKIEYMSNLNEETIDFFLTN